MNVRRTWEGLAVALMVVFAPARALAWQDAHQIGDDSNIRLDPRGVAIVAHALRWRVLRGPLRSIDLANVDPGAVLEAKVPVVADDGRTLGAQAVRRDDGIVRLTFDDPHGLMRGNFTIDVRWQIDLMGAGALSRDGATWRLQVSAPMAHDGFDGARTTIDLPAAPDEPRPINPENGELDDAAVATLRRGVERDVLELVRPHVARGESATWTVRVDPRAVLPTVDPRLHPPSEASPSGDGRRGRAALLLASIATLGLLFGLLIAQKARTFAAACIARGGRSSGLLPLPDVARAILGGTALAVAIGLEAVGETSWGAAGVLLATLAAAMRPARVRPAARGPGQWRALSPQQAFESAKSGPGLSVSQILLFLGLALLVVATIVLRGFDEGGAWIVALDSAALVPLVATGRASQLPPHSVRSAAPWLERAFRRLRAVPGIRVAPWGRVAPDGVTADELRLLILPRIAMPGVIGLEVGLAWSSTPVGWAANPQVLVRVVEGSAAAARLSRSLPHLRAVPGRGQEERVFRMLPRTPTRKSTLALVRGVAEALMDRRAASPVWCNLAPPPSGLRSTDVLNIRSPEGSAMVRQHECA
jgi:hypothetical protein